MPSRSEGGPRGAQGGKKYLWKGRTLNGIRKRLEGKGRTFFRNN
jgi:hypothetical protein